MNNNQTHVFDVVRPHITLKKAMSGILGLITLITLLGCFYTVPEGHIGVLTRFSKAIGQVEPGLHWKAPFIESVLEVDVRTRKNLEKMSVATAEQMPSNAAVSVNWSVPAGEVLGLFKQYGSLSQFEAKILDPRVRNAAKEAVAKYTAEQIIRNREIVVGDMRESLIKHLEGFVVTIHSVQLEDIKFPASYTGAVNQKQIALQDAQKEEHKLTKQKFVAQQRVQTAEAEAAAEVARATAEAFAIEAKAKAEAAAIRMKGLAEAAAIKAKAAALKSNPLIIELTKAQQWNGTVPTMITGGNTGFLMQVPGLVGSKK